MVELEIILTARSQQLTDWQKELTAANSLIITSQTRPERAQTEISSNQTRSQQIAAILKNGTARRQDADRRAARPAERRAGHPRARATKLRRRELAGNNAAARPGHQPPRAAHRARRPAGTGAGRPAGADQPAAPGAVGGNPSPRCPARRAVAGADTLLARETALNLKLTDYLLRTTDRLNELTQSNLRTKQRLDSLSQSEQALDEQIDVLRGSLLLSQILLEQKRALPQVKVGQRAWPTKSPTSASISSS